MLLSTLSLPTKTVTKETHQYLSIDSSKSGHDSSPKWLPSSSQIFLSLPLNLCDDLSSTPKMLLLLGNAPNCVLTQYASFTQQLSKCLALILTFKIFQRETDLWETCTCVTQSRQLVVNTLQLGCTRSIARIRQSTPAPSSLPCYRHVDLRSRCCDTDLGTYGTQGWHRTAPAAAAGTWQTLLRARITNRTDNRLGKSRRYWPFGV